MTDVRIHAYAALPRLLHGLQEKIRIMDHKPRFVLHRQPDLICFRFLPKLLHTVDLLFPLLPERLFLPSVRAIDNHHFGSHLMRYPDRILHILHALPAFCIIQMRAHGIGLYALFLQEFPDLLPESGLKKFFLRLKIRIIQVDFHAVKPACENPRNRLLIAFGVSNHLRPSQYIHVCIPPVRPDVCAVMLFL